MNREELKALLPHRGDMLLLDGAELVENEALGRYQVRGDEYFLRGHFPGKPVVPGVILLEILAQTACVLLKGECPKGTLPMYTGLDRARFRRNVGPGDIIETRCALTRVKKPFYFARGTVRVGEKLCAEADFSFAVTEGG